MENTDLLRQSLGRRGLEWVLHQLSCICGPSDALSQLTASGSAQWRHFHNQRGAESLSS